MATETFGIFDPAIKGTQVRHVRKLIDVLRSGEYKHEEGYLKCNLYTKRGKFVGQAFCVMGVACDVFAKKNWRGGEFIDGDTTSQAEFVLDGVGYYGSAPGEVLSYYGLAEKGVTSSPDGTGQTVLINLNDSGSVWGDEIDTKPWGFKKLASFMEKELEATLAARRKR